MPKTAEINSSFLEYRTDFNHPIFETLTRPQPMIQEVYSALRPWNLRPDGISSTAPTPALSNWALEFRLPEIRAVLKVGVAGVGVTISNPSWSEVERIVAAVGNGVAAVGKSSGAVLGSQSATLAVHLTPSANPAHAIVSRFINLERVRWVQNPEASGFSVRTADSSWVIDRSVVHLGALFFRLERTFVANVALSDIATTLRRDEEKLLEALELQLE
jgi:hypothetical protein